MPCPNPSSTPLICPPLARLSPILGLWTSCSTSTVLPLHLSSLAMADTATGKRPQPEGDVGGAPPLAVDASQQQAKRRRASSSFSESPAVVFRLVVPSRDIGKVIGKEGHRIQRVREETRATIKIVDPVTRYEDRVIIISSQNDDNNGCNAETALHSIARLLLMETESNTEALQANVGASASMMRLLISGCQIGCLLGVYGQFIEEVKSSSGAMVMILDQNQLACLSTQESDRVVQISGEVSQVLTALEKIGYMLRENPPQKVAPTRTVYNYNPTFYNPYNTYSPAIPNTYNSVAPAAEHATYEMLIMESLVGGLIGVNGSNISKIRSESGATIKITGMRGENLQRLITFGGSAHQVAVGRMLVENYICSQLMRQSRQ